MTSHTIKYVTLGEWPDCTYKAKCSCRWRTKELATRQAVEDQVFEHRNQVQRALASIRRGNPSLQSQRNHYQRMADDPDVSQQDRHMWQVLADELTHRLGDGPDREEEPKLW